MLLHKETIRLLERDMLYYQVSIVDLGMSAKYSFFRPENNVLHRCGLKNIQKIICGLCFVDDLYYDIAHIKGGKHITLTLWI